MSKTETTMTMENKPETTNGNKSNQVEDNLILRGDIYYPPVSGVAAAAATATTMKTLEKKTDTINNASSFPLNSVEENHTTTSATNTFTISTFDPLPSQKKKQPLPQDVILNDEDYGNAKFHKWILEHREAFSLATSLSSETILIQGLIQRVKKQNGLFLERTQKEDEEEILVELSDDAVTLGVARALRSFSQPASAVRRVSRPPSPIIRAMNVDQLQFASVMCMYSTPLWSYHAPIYDGVPSGITSKPLKVAAPITASKKKPMTTTTTTTATTLLKAAKSTNGTDTTTAASSAGAGAKAVDKKRKQSVGNATGDAEGKVKQRRMPARQIANSNSTEISPDAIESCINQRDPEMALAAYKILQTIEVQSLPRGVTARPSGKWQAQFYFDGQSRYIGVFDSAKAAAQAYECVHRLLAQSRPGPGHATRRHSFGGNSTSSSTGAEADPVHKEAMRTLFERARDAAMGAVANLQG